MEANFPKMAYLGYRGINAQSVCQCLYPISAAIANPISSKIDLPGFNAKGKLCCEEDHALPHTITCLIWHTCVSEALTPAFDRSDANKIASGGFSLAP